MSRSLRGMLAGVLATTAMLETQSRKADAMDREMGKLARESGHASAVVYKTKLTAKQQKARNKAKAGRRSKR